MRSAKKDELHNIAEFLVERFWGLEQHTFMSDGLSNPKELLTKVTESELYLYLSKGDIYVYEDELLKGVLVGIPTKKFTLFNIVLSSLKSNEGFKGVTKQDLKLLKEKSELQGKLHNRVWFKKYSKNAYYITQIAVAKEAKGSGVFRKLICPVIEECEKNNIDIVLETFTEANIPIYEHFGFELVETHTCAEMAFSEYCMIRRSK